MNSKYEELDTEKKFCSLHSPTWAHMVEMTWITLSEGWDGVGLGGRCLRVHWYPIHRLQVNDNASLYSGKSTHENIKTHCSNTILTFYSCYDNYGRRQWCFKYYKYLFKRCTNVHRWRHITVHKSKINNIRSAPFYIWWKKSYRSYFYVLQNQFILSLLNDKLTKSKRLANHTLMVKKPKLKVQVYYWL